MSTPKTLHTRDGAVDARALEALQQRFDTHHLLDAVDAIDRLRAYLYEPDAMRQELLTLHGMAHALIKGGDSGVATAPEAIWDLAEDLASEPADCIARLEVAVATLEELATLAPDPDDEDEGNGEGVRGPYVRFRTNLCAPPPQPRKTRTLLRPHRVRCGIAASGKSRLTHVCAVLASTDRGGFPSWRTQGDGVRRDAWRRQPVGPCGPGEVSDPSRCG